MYRFSPIPRISGTLKFSRSTKSSKMGSVWQKGVILKERGTWQGGTLPDTILRRERLQGGAGSWRPDTRSEKFPGVSRLKKTDKNTKSQGSTVEASYKKKDHFLYFTRCHYAGWGRTAGSRCCCRAHPVRFRCPNLCTTLLGYPQKKGLSLQDFLDHGTELREDNRDCLFTPAHNRWKNTRALSLSRIPAI